MMQDELTISRELRQFVMRAVQLPSDRLAAIHKRVRGGAFLLHEGTVTQVISRYPLGRQYSAELRSLIESEAKATALPDRERLPPEGIADAVLPAARALLVRHMLETALPGGARHRAFTALLEPYTDILTGIVDASPRPGQRPT